MNQKTVDALPMLDKKKAYRDDACPGLFVLVHPSGTKRYFLRYSWEGKQDSITLGDTREMTLAQARETASDHKYHLRQGVPPKLRFEKLTLERAIKQWYVEHREDLEPASQAAYKSRIDTHIIPALGKLDVRKVKRADVVRLVRSLADRPATGNMVLVILGAFYKWAQHVAEYVDATPVRAIKRYKMQGRERYLSPDERERLLAALADHPNQPFADAVRLLLMTGSRKSEIVNARWEWVDMAGGRLRFSGKTGETTRFLTGAAKQVLHRQPTREGRIFPTLSHGVFYRAWAKLMGAAEIEDLTPHDLRHDFASVAAAKTGDIYMVSKLLGHKNIGTTQRYAHLFDDPQQQAMEKIVAEYDVGTTELADVVEFKP